MNNMNDFVFQDRAKIFQEWSNCDKNVWNGVF